MVHMLTNTARLSSSTSSDCFCTCGERCSLPFDLTELISSQWAHSLMLSLTCGQLGSRQSIMIVPWSWDRFRARIHLAGRPRLIEEAQPTRFRGKKAPSPSGKEFADNRTACNIEINYSRRRERELLNFSVPKSKPDQLMDIS
ncbi:uncharacterized protein CLUP02_11590 [Colletotrichum lupini]|uniref:Uncharacterized protein n=1 Tax=Colletotrichum lupini TaxID=145971 RepID=A0A9Q8WKL8_9PEZI|nr:uncharacterized protein CLUP02_11590 [Colletotrichum lupini]UQC86090.1 hypothetical protein CLUP02_11590 [Colletotrichum lupini]